MFAGAFAAPAMQRYLGRLAGPCLALLPLYLAVAWSARYGRRVFLDGEVLVSKLSWIPSLDISASLYLDGLSLLFSLVILFMGALVVFYSSSYLEGHQHLGRFYLYLMLFMGSMLGVVLAGNLVLLFVFWELTSLSSYLLIGFHHDQAKSRRAALQALWITGSGGLALLAGLLMWGIAVGSFEFDLLLKGSGEQAPWILGLILLGAFTKSAQFPFHFWLPQAMAAPTPVSAYLHSATMVKAGIYLLARISPVFAGSAVWFDILTLVGATTMLLGAVLALLQTDLKLVLAYSTVSALGTLTLMLGVGTPKAVKAAVLFFIVHALYKGALFLVVGVIDHKTGTRELGELSGLRRTMPVTAVVAALAGLSMAGVPPLLGFVAKEAIYEGLWGSTLLFSLAFLSSVLTITAAAMVSISPFWGSPGQSPKPGQDPGIALALGPFLLAAVGLALGLFVSPAGRWLVGPATAAVLASAADVELALWHGFNLLLGMSFLALISGLLVYRFRPTLVAWAQAGKGFSFDRAYDEVVIGILRLCSLFESKVQHGVLRHYLLTVFIFAFSLTGWMLFSFVEFPPWSMPDLPIQYWAVAVLVVGGAVAALFSSSHLASIACVGVVGYGVAVIYILRGAPDVALTQLMVETLTVLLVTLAMVRLPKWVHRTDRVSSFFEALVAIGGGTVLGVLTWVVSSAPFDTSISDFYGQASYLQAHGRNVVNVILVDFRALDTLGEIVVLAIAGLGIHGLLRKGTKS